MAVKNELDLTHSLLQKELPVLCCTVLVEVEGMLPRVLVGRRIVTFVTVVASVLHALV